VIVGKFKYSIYIKVPDKMPLVMRQKENLIDEITKEETPPEKSADKDKKDQFSNTCDSSKIIFIRSIF